jgi:hypothetical protein
VGLVHEILEVVSVCGSEYLVPHYTAAEIIVVQITDFWDVTPCGLVDVYQRFLGTYYLDI